MRSELAARSTPRFATRRPGPARAFAAFQDGDQAFLEPAPPSDLEAVETRHEDVEDHRVGLVAFERGKRCEPVVRELDLVPLELESAAERLAHRPFVVHDQDLHGSIVALMRGNKSANS